MTEIITKTALTDTFLQQKEYFDRNTYPSYQTRINDLKKLKALLINNQEAFINTMSQDFGHRSATDSRIGDILTTVMGINYAIKKLKKWMKPEKKHIGILFQPAKGEVVYQPKGVIGIIAPWNYPVFLTLGPLTTALAAGNTAMIKMSEYTPKTNTLLATLLAEIFPQHKVAIVCGEADMAAAFSGTSFDHIFFTGSTGVGKLVMKAAAENLVPVTLELGGKSPTIIDNDIDIKTAVNRLILGKVLNAGQTCVAPDYIFCPENKVDELSEAFQTAYQSMYPNIAENDDYSCIINDSQKSRLDSLLADAKAQGAKIMPLATNTNDKMPRKMPLTLITDVNDDMTVMQQEIFGPLLPIISYKKLDEVITYINSKPRPLALYICSFNKSVQQKILLNTHAGGVCINEAAFHVAVDDLPFGGIGASGMGQYHGDEGFKTFSHGKSVFSRGKISLGSLLFPPFGNKIHQLLFKLFIR
jgi:coniferyl-aldehyde dehydrogenase